MMRSTPDLGAAAWYKAEGPPYMPSSRQPIAALVFWLVLGVAGEAAQAIEDPHVLIVLRDSAGAEIARRTIEIAADPLPSASAWLFRKPLRPATLPASA